ncbi:MAG: DNA gyrase C-terminal beta-propeller domain-containing protein, partial [Candidatus Moraniibacteriota bacterium]
DSVVGMDILHTDNKNSELIIITENGYGKRSPVKNYKIQHRGGSGIKTAKITAKIGKIVSAQTIDHGDVEDADVISTSQKGTIIRIPLKSVPVLSRVTQGVRVMRPQAGDHVASFTIL